MSFLHSCSEHATFLKILGQDHLSSSYQVRSSDPTTEKKSNRVTAIVVERQIRNFQDLVYYQVPTTCISRIFFYIGDVSSGQFRDLPILSQWKIQIPQMLIRSFQIVQTRAQLGYCWWPLCIVQRCICDTRKGHLRSCNDVMRSIYTFADNFWLD